MRNKIAFAFLSVLFICGQSFAATLPTSETTTFIGETINDRVGTPISLGDVNGDSVPDILISAYNANGGGKAYLVYGTTAKFPTVVNLSTVGSSTPGVVFQSNVYTGRTVTAVGDINFDGLNDFIIGTGLWSTQPGFYLVYGSRTFPANVNLQTTGSVNGVFFAGVLPSSVSVGDINRDGKLDIVSDTQYDSSVRVFYGGTFPVTGQVPANQDSYYDGVKATKIVTSNSQGFSSPKVADVNKDGYADILYNVNGNNYLLFGKSTTLGSIVLATDSYFTGTNGTRFVGDSYWNANLIGDVNGNGYQDIGFANGGSGKTTIVFGRQVWPATVNLTQLDGTNATAINQSFNSMVSAGDYNGDGIKDLALSNVWNRGQVNIVLGRKVWTPTTTIDPQGQVYIGEATAKGLSFSQAAGNLYGGNACPNTLSYLFGASGDNYTVGRAYIVEVTQP